MPSAWGEKRHKVFNSRFGVQQLLKAYCGHTKENHKAVSHNLRFRLRNGLKSLESTTTNLHKKLCNIISSKGKPIELPLDSTVLLNLSIHGTPGNKKSLISFMKPVSVEAYTRINELQMQVQQLREKVDILTEYKKEIQEARNTKNLLNEIEQAYENYTKLSEITLKQKTQEKKAFEKYIEACQHEQKAIVDIKQELSHQRMKTKLLHEVLEKRNQEYNSIMNKKRELVSNHTVNLLG